mmetsp:Transcript_21107/g.55565  ORF Transcript_21107/g.55565 Transcript_21107/m.55565 type:complete len:231 (-) Transcript_21107:94-786(-)
MLAALSAALAVPVQPNDETAGEWLLSQQMHSQLANLRDAAFDELSTQHSGGRELMRGRELRSKVTHRVYFDLEADGSALGRIVVGLFGNAVPKTVDNFIGLAKGELVRNGRPLRYEGTKFHRIIGGFMMQGGNADAARSQGDSIWGGAFADENFALTHSAAGMLSMANAGKNTNKSQFFITFKPTPHLDGKHVVFGQVLSGMDIVRRVEGYGRRSGKPTAEIRVASCGLL